MTSIIDQALVPVPAATADGSSGRRRGRVFAGGIACAALALVPLAFLAHRIPFFAIDLTITRQVQSLQAVWIDLLLRPLNMVGFPPLVGIIYGSIILAILAAGARWEAVAATFATLGAAGLNHLMKALVDRPRPPMDLVHVAHHLPGSGFPAGHVLNFTAFVGFLCYLTWVRPAPSWRRTVLIVFLLTMIALMGIARIYAGEHWPSDVLGGYFLGIVWLAATVEFYRWGRRRSRNRHPSRHQASCIDTGSTRTVATAGRPRVTDRSWR
jgi:undecaprenyl-diphosphatase